VDTSFARAAKAHGCWSRLGRGLFHIVVILLVISFVQSHYLLKTKETTMPRINSKFAKLAGRIMTADSTRGLSARSLRQISVVAEKAGALSGGGEEAASTVGTICTSECISTASSVCLAGDLTSVTQRDPDLVKAIGVLHDRAVNELGEDGLAEAMVKLSK